MIASLLAVPFTSLVCAAAADAFRQNERLGRGVNIIGWDVLWQNRDRGHFKNEHFSVIHEAGFSHVRINLHPLRDGKPDAQGNLRKEFFTTLDWAIDQALANKLLVILDYHDDLAISPDPAGNKSQFLASWAAIADHCQGRPSEVLFEILNEPAPKFTHESWSNYWHEALAIIRKSDPSRTVIIGADAWNSFKQLESLQLPETDRNLIVTFHYYDPFEFTHQGTPWTGQRDKTGVSWQGTEKERQKIEQDFDQVQAWAKRQNRPIYLGEFGAYEKGDMDSRARWTGFVARQAEKRGFSWAYWQFAGDFVLFDMSNQKWVEPIREALIPTTAAAKPFDEKSVQHWTREEPLGEAPKRVNAELPLSDQENRGQWVKFEPMWDEFDGPMLNSNKWIVGMSWWQGRQPAWFSPSNVVVRDGQLHLIMRKEAVPKDVESRGYHDYSSAALHTQARACYGYFEVKAQAMNSGGSSSFWFQQEDQQVHPGWATEIDVFELCGKSATHDQRYYMTVHVSGTPQEKRHWQVGSFWRAPWRFTEQFHVYGFDWGRDQLRWYVDGQLVHTVQNTHWHQPLYLIFDSETMPDWFGMPQDADLPSTFSVEYMRAWKQQD